MNERKEGERKVKTVEIRDLNAENPATVTGGEVPGLGGSPKSGLSMSPAVPGGNQLQNQIAQF